MTWTDPRTWVAGEVITAALLNTHVRDNLKAVGDALGSYTPTYTNFALGNGTVDARYAQVGKWVRCRGLITLGSTSSVTGLLRIALPVAANFTTFGRPIDGRVELFDTSASARRFWNPAHQSGTEFYIADASDNRADNAAPWAWATGDTIAWSFQYEAA